MWHGGYSQLLTNGIMLARFHRAASRPVNQSISVPIFECQLHMSGSSVRWFCSGATALAAMMLLTSCAVSPDFLHPAAPEITRYTAGIFGIAYFVNGRRFRPTASIHARP